MSLESPNKRRGTVESSQPNHLTNARMYIVNNDTVYIKEENQLWEIDKESVTVGLFRQNAMTFYQEVSPYLILAQAFDTGNPLFYLVKVKNHPRFWVQVDIDTGDNVYNILKN